MPPRPLRLIEQAKMLRAVGWYIVFMGSVLFCASPSASQTVGDSTGAIEGTVTDRTAGRGVPGLRACASGPRLMTPRCSDSGADGSYRIQALPPGDDYVLTFSLPDFTPAHTEGVRVGLGATTTRDVTIDITQQRLEVAVQESSIDRIAPTRGDRFTEERLASLPGSRNMGAILTATDSVLMSRHDVGGSSAMAIGIFSAYGIRGLNRPTLEGINVSGLNPLAFSLDYGSFDEVLVGLAAYGPEFPTPGVHMQFLTKQGGDQYRGSAYVGVETERLQARNIDADQIARGAPAGQNISATEGNRLARYHDLNADVGGFLRRGRLWLYISGRDQRVDANRVTYPASPIPTRASSVSGKVTVRVGDHGQVIVYAHRSVNEQPIKLDGFLLSAETAVNQSEGSTTEQIAKGQVWKAEFTRAVGRSLFVEFRVGQFIASRGESPNGGLAEPRKEDRISALVSGTNREFLEEQHRSQATGAVSYGRGNHLLKVGGEVMRWNSAETWTNGYDGDVLHDFANGLPASVYLFQTPSRSENGQWWHTGFASDTWRVTSRLTLTPGLRFDRFRVFLPDQIHPASRFNPTTVSFPAVDNLIDWNVFAPRLGASHSLGANHQVVVKGSYGLYWLPPTPDLGLNANPNARTWLDRFSWSDSLIPDGVWQPGEERNLLERRGGSPDTLDPGLKLPYAHEVTAHVEHQAGGGILVSSGVVLRSVRQQGAREPAAWPYDAFTETRIARDPGPDSRLGTADDGPDVTFHDVPAGLAGSAGFVVRNVPHADSDYVTLEATAERGLRNRWALSGSFAMTWNRDQASGYFGQTVRNNALPSTPNDFIHTDDKGRHVFTLWTAKLFGTYEAPLEFKVTPFVRHQSGQPFGRTLQNPPSLPLNVGSVRVLAEPVGTRRQDHVTLLDLRVERAFRIKGSRLTGFVEVFNALNANPEQNVSWLTATFERPLAIVPPRIARLGMKYDW